MEISEIRAQSSCLTSLLSGPVGRTLGVQKSFDWPRQRTSKRTTGVSCPPWPAVPSVS